MDPNSDGSAMIETPRDVSNNYNQQSMSPLVGQNSNNSQKKISLRLERMDSSSSSDLDDDDDDDDDEESDNDVKS